MEKSWRSTRLTLEDNAVQVGGRRGRVGAGGAQGCGVRSRLPSHPMTQGGKYGRQREHVGAVHNLMSPTRFTGWSLTARGCVHEKDDTVTTDQPLAVTLGGQVHD